MGKSVYVLDEVYEKLSNESHKIGVPMAHILKAIVDNEEKMRENQKKIDNEKIEEKEIKKEQEKNDQKNEQKSQEKQEKKSSDEIKKKEAKKMPEFDERKIEDLIEKILSQKEREVERNNELRKIKTGFENLRNKFCDASGRWCFATREDLEKFEKEQKKFVGESLEDIKKTLNEIKDNEVKKQAKAIEPKALEGLRGRKWSELSPVEQEALKDDLSQNYSHRLLYETLISCPECSQTLVRRVANRPEVKEKVLSELSTQEIMEKCDLGNPEACKILVGRGYKLQKRDEKGRWKVIAEPEKPRASARGKF